MLLAVLLRDTAGQPCTRRLIWCSAGQLTCLLWTLQHFVPLEIAAASFACVVTRQAHKVKQTHRFPKERLSRPAVWTRLWFCLFVRFVFFFFTIPPDWPPLRPSPFCGMPDSPLKPAPPGLAPCRIKVRQQLPVLGRLPPNGRAPPTRRRDYRYEVQTAGIARVPLPAAQKVKTSPHSIWCIQRAGATGILTHRKGGRAEVGRAMSFIATLHKVKGTDPLSPKSFPLSPRQP